MKQTLSIVLLLFTLMGTGAYYWSKKQQEKLGRIISDNVYKDYEKQASTPEATNNTDFHKLKGSIKNQINKKSCTIYTCEEAEDASSSFIYRFHYQKDQLLKAEEFWNGGCCSPSTSMQFYFGASYVLCELYTYQHKYKTPEEASEKRANESYEIEVLIYDKEKDVLIGENELTSEKMIKKKSELVEQVQYLETLFSDREGERCTILKETKEYKYPLKYFPQKKD